MHSLAFSTTIKTRTTSAARWLLNSLILTLILTLSAATAAAQPNWLDADGQPLPFTSNAAAVEFLANAEIITQKQLNDGSNKPLKLTLQRDGITAHAIFRTVDHKVNQRNLPRQRRELRDSYIFEVAAFELSQMLGIDNVPPATLRTLGGKRGSVQLWVENATSESRRIANQQQPKKPASWHRQKQALALFDSLIYNFDRNTGNMLFDASGKLWYVDHTRTFKTLPALPWAANIQICDEQFWNALRALEPAQVRIRLSPYLSPLQISTLLERRTRLVRKIEQLIAERGIDAVLYQAERLVPVQLASLDH